MDARVPSPETIRAFAYAPGRGTAQRNRRARILAAARRSVAELGYKRLTVRSVSDRCALTPQTIYNLVGDKANLIKESIVEYFEMIEEAAGGSDNVADSARVIDLYWQATAAEPGFIKEVSVSYFDTDPLFGRSLEAFSKALLKRAFVAMQREGRLSGTPDLDALAECATAANAATYSAWARSALGLDELRLRLARSHALLMSGYTPADAAAAAAC